jgi:hypothetical protein
MAGGPCRLAARYIEEVFHTQIEPTIEGLRWCVMPLQPGEVAASLADWAEDQFAGAEA